ncbi:MAG: serine hydrolase [Bacteroidia bacterium]|nr:serine hydrolase [Bacteroidia bacterium]MBP9689918.1 serine hydrolase [Bacteroidia bacterium]
MNRYLMLIWVVLFPALSQAQSSSINWKKSNPWVDSVYNSLTEDERIAQLFMVDVWTLRDTAHFNYVESLVREYKVGGLIFFKGTPYKQATLTNNFQSKSKIPLLVGIDGEWGLSMRLDSTPVYPRQMVLGASANPDLVYEMGMSIGSQCKRMGIQFNFAPDIDVNNNANNPVINDRSFGENKYTVAKLGAAYTNGLQEMHVIASAKHFPGHGDTETDSHYGLPVIKADRKRLDSLELYPFKKLIEAGAMSIMVAHLNIPALDSTNTPSSLSKPIITDLLRNQMGFEGIIITDALNMKGVADLYPPGEVAAKALLAGNDILLFVENVPASMAKIKEHIADSSLTWAQIESSCKRVLLAKYWSGLNNYEPIELTNLTQDLNAGGAPLMIKKAVKNSIIVAKNLDDIIPVKNPELYKIATIGVGIQQLTAFQEMCLNYCKSDYFSIDKTDKTTNFDSLYLALEKYNLVIISLQSTSRFVSRKLGLTQSQIDFVNRIILSQRKVVLVCNGNPYILNSFQNARNVIVSYEDLEMYNYLAAEVLFGAVAAKGKMPVGVGAAFPLGSGINTNIIERFTYELPEEIGLPSDAFSKLDSIAIDAINKRATPGCQILVAKQGKVVYQKSFGYHNYDNVTAVKNHHLYDVASLTKILATTVAVMHLYDEHKIKLDDKLSTYLPMLVGTNKEDILVQDILLHQAGLVAYIPIYKNTLLNGKPNPIIYQANQDSVYTIQVAPNLFMHQDYEQFVWDAILKSDVKPRGNYVYSDLGFILLRKAIENITQMPFDSFLNENIYKPLNLSNLTFNPLSKVNADWIVPTEMDTFFRWQLVNGTVHDQTAAMLGGISGHAGVFGSANDVSIIMQMLLDGGEYGGKRILKESTVNLFTKKQGKTRRGLGFDKPEMDIKKGTPTSRLCSAATFGHTGFTGTCAWVDPKSKLVFVFLSNRVNPSSENKKLVELNVRTNLQDAIYEALKME